MQPHDHANGESPLNRGRGLRHSWLSFKHAVLPACRGPDLFMRNVAISILHVEQGDVRGFWVSRGREVAADGAAGTVRLNPADGFEHLTYGSSGQRGMRYVGLIIPPWQLSAVAEEEGTARRPCPRVMVWPDDAELRRSLSMVTAASSADDPVNAEDRDVASRALLLRLAELMGAGKPGWHADTSVFTSRVMEDLVGWIDASLRLPPDAEVVAARCGLSLSHFARKFRQSTGVSFQRFVNRRRVEASFERLKHAVQPLKDVSLDLGFSSQSHFTRVFSDSTGMTPARYRQEFRRTVG